jgi:hypothetical protein
VLDVTADPSKRNSVSTLPDRGGGGKAQRQGEKKVKNKKAKG